MNCPKCGEPEGAGFSVETLTNSEGQSRTLWLCCLACGLDDAVEAEDDDARSA